jgi:hypothetical protein
MAYKLTLTTWAILAMFIVGLLFSSTYTARNVQEAFQGIDSSNGASNKNRCPNVLIQKGTELYLHNNRMANVPGVNPLKFNNLEDYVEFTEWQRSQGIRCPVLYMQHSFDAQGKPVYKIRPGPMDLQGGLPPVASGIHDSDSVSPGSSNANADYIDNADEPPGNLNSYPAFDPMDHNAGSIGNSKPLKGLSANPMASNWGGDKYTTSLINAGKYEGNEVQISVPS